MNRSILLLTALLLSFLHVSAQKPQAYFSVNEMPDAVKYLPAPPDSLSMRFAYDTAQYQWGKRQRNTPRGQQAKDDADYGIYRILCSEPDKAYKILKDAGVAISLSEVFAIELDDVPGKAADAIDFLAKEDISISYLYSFLLKGKGVLIFRTDNTEKAQEAIDRNGLKVIEEKDISKLL